MREPADASVRPTTDRVKESIFNIVQFDVEGRRVLDLFAGTGQLGIEALSRGAAQVTFVDSDPASIQLVRENLRRTGLEQNARVFRGDAAAALAKGEQYDLVFLDPPYDSGLMDMALENILAFDILKVNGIIVCESRVGKQMPSLSEPYEKRKTYRYGKIQITVYDKTPATRGEVGPL